MTNQVLHRAITLLLQVLVPKKEDYLGKLVEVEIVETGKHYMRGRPIDTSPPMPPSTAEPMAKGAVSGLVGTQTGAEEMSQAKQDLLKQERYIILSFVLLISALLVKLVWVCLKMVKDL